MHHLPVSEDDDALLREDVSSCEDRQPYGLRILRNAFQESYQPLFVLVVNNTDAYRIVWIVAATD